MRNKEDLVAANKSSRHLIPREEQHLFHVLVSKQARVGDELVTTTWVKCYRPVNYRAFEKLMASGSKIDFKAATGFTQWLCVHDPRLEARKKEVAKRKAEKEAKQ